MQRPVFCISVLFFLLGSLCPNYAGNPIGTNKIDPCNAGLVTDNSLESTTKNASAGDCKDCKTRKKQFRKSYSYSSNTLLRITNKYGNIVFKPWEKDSIRVEAEIIAKSSNPGRLNELLDLVDISSKTAGNEITVQTVFKETGGSIKNNVLTINITNERDINYTVYLPRECKLDVSNSYGNVTMDNHSGSVEMVVNSGSLTAGTFSGTTKISSSYTDIIIQRTLAHTSFEITSSTLNLKQANRIHLVSKFSTVTLGRLESADVTANYGKIEMNKVDEVRVTSDYTTLVVNNLLTSGALTSRYGSFSVKNIAPGFQSVNLDSRYTNLTLSFAPDAAYSYHLTMEKILQVALPASFTKTTAANSIATSSGNIGNSRTGTLTVKAYRGSLKIL